MQSWNLPGSDLFEIEYERITSGSLAGWGTFTVTNWPALYVKFGSSVSNVSSKTSYVRFL